MLTTMSIAAAHDLPLELVEAQFREARSAGLPHERALEFTADLAQGIVDERKRLR